MIFSAPAKLNLMLHVLGRRADGYHELQTIFQLVDLCDRLEISPRPDGVIRRVSGPADVAESDDLTVRAGRALQAATGTTMGAGCTIYPPKTTFSSRASQPSKSAWAAWAARP